MGKSGKRRVAIILSAILVLGLVNVTGPSYYFGGGGSKVAKAAQTCNLTPGQGADGFYTYDSSSNVYTLRKAANYVLQGDIDPGRFEVVASTGEEVFTLDLNGHRIKNYTGSSSIAECYVVKLSNDVSNPAPHPVFNITDTAGGGAIMNTNNKSAGDCAIEISAPNAVVKVNGGSIETTGTIGCCIIVEGTNSELVLNDGGTIKGSSSQTALNAVYLGFGSNADQKFTMNGGVIEKARFGVVMHKENNVVDIKGGSIRNITQYGVWMLGGHGVFSMTDGEIDCYSNNNFGTSGVKCQGSDATITMSEGVIKNCAATYTNTSEEGCGICVENNPTFNMTGGRIENCNRGIKLSGANDQFTMSGGVIDGNDVNDFVGILADNTGQTITMSGTGGIIRKANTGVHLNKANQTFLMTSGTISGGTYHKDVGVKVSDASPTVTLGGGLIDSFLYGVNLAGTAAQSFTMNGGEIKDCTTSGVFTSNGSKTVNIAGGKIYSTNGTGTGVAMNGGGAFSMTDGEISGVNTGFSSDGSAGTFTMSGGKIIGCNECGVNQNNYSIALSNDADISNQAPDPAIYPGGRRAPDIKGFGANLSYSNMSKPGYIFHIRSEEQGDEKDAPVGANDGRYDMTNVYVAPGANTCGALFNNVEFLYTWWELEPYNPPSNPDPVPVATPTPTATPTATPTPTPTATPINEPDDKGDKFGMLLFRVVKRTKTTLKLKWHKLPDADGYDLYGNQCNEGGKKREVKYIESYGKKTTSVIRSKLKKGKYYKYKLVAFKKVNGKKVPIVSSVHVHATTLGTDENTVAKKVKTYVIDGETKTLVKKKLTIKKGDTLQLDFEEIPEEKDKEIKPHRKVKFESQKAKIVKVNKNTGEIKGLKKGKAVIYVYAQNGIYDKITVKVT